MLNRQGAKTQWTRSYLLVILCLTLCLRDLAVKYSYTATGAFIAGCDS